jgi:hypothetical protein
MGFRRFLKLLSIVALLVIAVLLFADLKSIHQVYRIPDDLIDRAPGLERQNALREMRDHGDRHETAHKTGIELLLAADAISILLITSTFLPAIKDSSGGKDS